jgi:DNA excision repair protein ERCC-6
MQTCVELAAEAKRFLLFTWTKEMARQLQAACIAAGARCVRLDGDMPHAKRQAAIHEAKDKRWGIVSTLDAGGEGLNLQFISYGIFHALPWEPNKLAQARDRLYRFGQTEPVQWVIPILRDSADELVLRKVVQKLNLFVSNKNAVEGMKEMRDALDAGPAGTMTDAEAMKAIYEGMEDDDD